VALVGDFNDWDAAATPMSRAASADCWSVSLPVERGRHVYGFVVDRGRWLPDPGAPVAPEDGFGSPGSVIVVGSGS
jgi:1,4-alpha-glucan branching enzyme